MPFDLIVIPPSQGPGATGMAAVTTCYLTDHATRQLAVRSVQEHQHSPHSWTSGSRIRSLAYPRHPDTARCVARHRHRSDADRPVDAYTLRMTTPEDAGTGGLAAHKRSDSTASGGSVVG